MGKQPPAFPGAQASDREHVPCWVKAALLPGLLGQHRFIFLGPVANTYHLCCNTHANSKFHSAFQSECGSRNGMNKYTPGGQGPQTKRET